MNEFHGILHNPTTVKRNLGKVVKNNGINRCPVNYKIKGTTSRGISHSSNILVSSNESSGSPRCSIPSLNFPSGDTISL